MPQPQNSSHVTRRQTRSQHYDRDDDSDDSQDQSSASSQSFLNDSRYSSRSLSRYDSSIDDGDRSPRSDSLDKSRSFNSSRLYPLLPEELHESGDFSPSYNLNRKKDNLYPKLESASQPLGNNKAYSIISVIFLILPIFVLLFYLNSNSSAAESHSNSKSGYEFFEDELKNLKVSFPTQTDRFWATISASALHVYEQQDPCYPSVILMASQNKNQRLNMCLAKKIASTFTASFGRSSKMSTIGTNVEDLKHMTEDEQKLHLDRAMQESFEQEKEKAFVISNVHFLSPKASLLLHGFCDGDNAPFKHVMIIMTFQVDDSIVFKSVKEVEHFLIDVWSKGLDMDKLSALMSRVGNNPVVVMAEDDSTVNRLCS